MSSSLGSIRNMPLSAKTRSRAAKGKNVMPQTENERKIVENLMEHSRKLQYRLQEMESKLILSENNAENLRYELDMAQRREAELISSMQFGSRLGSRASSPLLSSHGRRNPNILSRDGEHSSHPFSHGTKHTIHAPVSPGSTKRPRSKAFFSSQGSRVGSAIADSMNGTVSGMEDHISELRHLFKPTDPLEERNWASIKIQSCIRTFIVRKRYLKYWAAVSAWRRGRCAVLLPILNRLLDNASRVELGISAMLMRRQQCLVGAIFNRWQHICRQSAPFRRSMLVAAEEKFQAIRFRLLLRVCMCAFIFVLY